MTETSLAIEAHQKSIAYAMTGEKEKWLELFMRMRSCMIQLGHPCMILEARGRAGMLSFRPSGI
jgi:hypothetical protein